MNDYLRQEVPLSNQEILAAFGCMEIEEVAFTRETIDEIEDTISSSVGLRKVNEIGNKRIYDGVRRTWFSALYRITVIDFGAVRAVHKEILIHQLILDEWFPCLLVGVVFLSLSRAFDSLVLFAVAMLPVGTVALAGFLKALQLFDRAIERLDKPKP